MSTTSHAARGKRHQDVTDSVHTYFHEIGEYALLSPEAEAALARRARAGDDAALSELICANLRFVVSVAKRYRREGVGLADLVSEGNLGLIRAARRYDPERGVRFVSYASWWVRQGILHALTEQAQLMTVPRRRLSEACDARRRAARMTQQLQREPTWAELAESNGFGESPCSPPITQGWVSLDADMDGDGEMHLKDIIADPRMPAADHAIGVSASAMADQLLRSLPVRQALVLRLHFGMSGDEPMTLEAIGHRLGVTRERVRELKERALATLRRSPLLDEAQLIALDAALNVRAASAVRRPRALAPCYQANASFREGKPPHRCGEQHGRTPREEPDVAALRTR